jgi:hypothetical protein
MKPGGEAGSSTPPLVRLRSPLPSERRFEKGGSEVVQLSFHLPGQLSGNSCRENRREVK